MAKSQQKGVNSKGPVPKTTPTTAVRLREDERAALGRIMVTRGCGPSEAIRYAIEATDRAEAEGLLVTPMMRLESGVEMLVRELRKHPDVHERLFAVLNRNQAQIDARVAALEQSLGIVLGAVIGAGMTGDADRQRSWLRQLSTVMDLQKRGKLGEQLQALMDKAAVPVGANS